MNVEAMLVLLLGVVIVGAFLIWRQGIERVPVPAEAGFCERRIARELERAERKGPRKALLHYGVTFAFDSLGLPGGVTFGRSVEAGAQGAKGGGWLGALIAGIVGAGAGTAEQFSCRSRLIDALERRFGPRESWPRGRVG